MNVSLTPDLERFVREKVESGLYNSASEVVREALRLLLSREEERDIAPAVAESPVETYGPTRSPAASLEEAATKLQRALELLRLSHALMEQNLRRQHPEASKAEIDRRLADWRAEADWGEEAPGHLERSPERLEKLRRAAD